MAASRPPHQRWIKRPPRPSRTGPGTERRTPPGMSHFVMACLGGLVLGLAGILAGPHLVPERAGMAGLFAGLGFALAFVLIWRAFGGRREDIRRLFR